MASTKSLISIFRLVLPVILAVFGRISECQLVGCDAVGCPLNKYSQPECTIGNLSANEIGVANVSTTISPEPLTWTLSISTANDPTNSSQGIFSRDFYLGIPPSLDLQTSTSFQACALFFEGISSQLAFPLHGLSTDVGTCSDALNSACVKDLMSQAQSYVDKMAAVDKDASAMCQTLEGALRDSAPKTCNSTYNDSWGTITVQELTGPSSAGPLAQGSCHPTTGKNYSLSHVDSYSITGPDKVTFTGDFMAGITPIMTIFFPNSSSTIGGLGVADSISSPELHLTCMKAVGSLAGCTRCAAIKGIADAIRPTIQLGVTAAIAVIALVVW